MSHEFIPTKEVTTVTTRKWEISAETIEALLTAKLGVAGMNADFYWDCSSSGFIRGVHVTVKSSNTKIG
jgi:hypothetical protein